MYTRPGCTLTNSSVPVYLLSGRLMFSSRVEALNTRRTPIRCPDRAKQVFNMADTPAITDRNLEATTNISLKREPACFAFLSACSISPPMPIDSINLDLASADYFDGRASLWTTLEMRSSISDERPMALLGFDETFLRPFSRALIEAATSRAAYRMTILPETRASERCRVVEYVTGPGKALEEVILQPFDSVVLIGSATAKGSE